MKNLLCIFQMVLFMSCRDRDTLIDKSTLLGNDYRLFQATPVWNLAKAVQDENIEEIKRIVRDEKVNIDYQDERFGNTLLMLTIYNQQYKSCETLLDLGASPNKHDNYDGSSAIIDAAGINETSDDNTKFLKILLKHGGNPNAIEVGERREGNTSRNTPLIMACGSPNKIVSPIEKVKILVDSGADINYKNEFGTTALKMAYVQEHFDVVLYLLEKGADYNIPLFNRNDKDVFIWDELRDVLFPLASKEHQQKMAIVEFLKQKGIDYRKLPIPDYVVTEAKETYPKNWKEYLGKY